MSKSDAFETDILKKVFQNVTLPWDAGAVLYVGLHEADPTETGDQESNETDYAGYARVSVARSSSGWSFVGNQVSNATPFWLQTLSRLNLPKER